MVVVGIHAGSSAKRITLEKSDWKGGEEGERGEKIDRIRPSNMLKRDSITWVKKSLCQSKEAKTKGDFQGEDF